LRRTAHRYSLLLLAAFSFSTSASIGACQAPGQLHYRVLSEHVHDTNHYTQGLVFVGDALVESTGQYGRSQIIRYAPDYSPAQRLALPRQHFGEGLAWFQQRLWQLTWKAGELHIYNFQPLQRKKTIAYSGEAWGLTNDDEKLYLSDGSAELSVRDENFTELRRVTVRSGEQAIDQLNELEWVQGQIFANIWQSDQIAQINPETGCVSAWLDLSDLWPQSQRPRSADVLNGMAWHPAREHLFVTGKWWPRLYELAIIPMDQPADADKPVK
jgi:glutamine cyclotransferase